MTVEPKELTDDARRRWRPRPTLPGPSYHSQVTWGEERERIFYSEWICVGREEEIPGPDDFMVRPIADESVIVVRAREGGLRGFYNVCAHRGTKLCDDGIGHARSGVFKCPYHAWTYNTQGRLVGTPNVHEEEGFDRSTRPLWHVAVDTWGGFVFVNLTDSAVPEPLDDFFSRNEEGHPDVYRRWGVGDLRIGHRIEYEVAANWKILLENYNECLHCPSIHPELVQLVPIFRKGLTEGRWGAQLAEGAQTLTLDGKTGRPLLPGLEQEDRKIYVGMTVFPTLLINFHPDCVMTYRLEPLGPGRTRVVSEYLFMPDVIASEDFDPSDIAGLWDLVSKQDWDVCERAQTGVRSRAYSRGGVYPFNDRWVYEFTKRYLNSMGG